MNHPQITEGYAALLNTTEHPEGIFSLQRNVTGVLSLFSYYSKGSRIYLSFFRSHGQALLYRVVPFITLVLLPLTIVYITTSVVFLFQRQRKGVARVPATVPYVIPYLGSAISVGLSPSKFLAEVKNVVGYKTSYGIKLLGTTVYILHGRENISQVRRCKATITSPTYVWFLLVRVFGMNPNQATVYSNDDSGLHATPSPHSIVTPNNRVDHFTHWTFTKYLGGNAPMSRLFNRSWESFSKRLSDLKLGAEWIECVDIMDFWTPLLAASLIEATTGPLLECINPEFAKDLITFTPYLHPLLKCLPRWLLPEGYRIRESLIRDIKHWQSIARARFTESDISSDGDADPWWGCEFIRERQKFFSRVEGWDNDAIARSDLGLLWGFALNVHPAMIWTIVEIFKDDDLLSRVRGELKAAKFEGVTSKDQADKLLSLPLLNAIYAEVLRLRVDVYHIFHSIRDRIQLKEWSYPERSVVVIPTKVAHMDENEWNTINGLKPLNKFWADRFLEYPNDPESGPAKRKPTSSRHSESPPQINPGKGSPKFKDTGVADIFVPYGVGERTCPGRFFSRRAIISFCATIVNDFDIELLDKDKHFESSSEFWGTGTQRPAKKIPFKIRQRQR
ncbi:cytochrome P450 [Tricladium varicosporioides]|nr:cytochrome P450 [Hymenoscyphus varicosporioides]